MASFKIPCPSCENEVLITNPNVIGTKVECPKCKYRFKAEEPAGGIPKDEGKEAKADKGKTKDKDKAKDKKKAAVAAGAGGGESKKKKSKKLVAIVVGGLAVVVLAVVGFAMMGGDKKPKSTAGGGGGGYIPPPNTAGSNTAGNTPDGTDETADPSKKKDPDPKKVTTPVVEPLEPGRKSFPPSDKNDAATTNLLPGQTTALIRFDYAKLRQTPLASLFGPVMAAMFESSFGFRFNDVSTYYHAYVGDTRAPFGVIYLRHPVAAPELLPEQFIAGKPAVIKKRALFTMKSNPFVNGVASALSFHSLLADYLKAPTGTARKDEERTIGLCVYDSQHVLIGDRKILESFLSGLDDKGYPKFSSVASEKPMYRSLDDYRLKNALIKTGAESANPAAIIYAAAFSASDYDLKLIKSDYQPVTAVLDPVLSRTRYVTAALTALNARQMNLTIRLIMDSETSALEVVKENISPGLTSASQALSQFLDAPVDFHDYTTEGSPGAPGGGISPLGPGGMNPMGIAPPTPGKLGTSLGGPPGGAGSLAGPPGGLGSLGGPPSPGKLGSSLGGPPGGLGSLGGPPGGMGSLGGPPPGPGGVGPSLGGGMGPGDEGGMGFDGPAVPKRGKEVASSMGLGVSDRDVILTLELNWSEETYRRLIAPRVMGLTSTIKGKMAVYASDRSYHALSTAVPRMLAAKKAFPRGTAERRMADVSRMGLSYKPETRVSFFAEILPFINPARASAGYTLNRNLAWFDEKNLTVAEAWIPELLVPLYPQSAWRANWPDTPGRVFGGTNYVAIAGVGLDAARYDPKTEAKKVGITGYDWGSKVEEVADGLANTIYLMQTPPGLSQPWLAGGGATVRGLDEKDPMKGFRHKHGTPDGKEGTFALMADGSVRFIPGNIDPKLLLAMATRAGGENISARLDKEAPLVYSPNGKKKETELKSNPKGPAPRTSDSPPAKPKAKDPPSKSKSDSSPEPKEKK